MNSISREKYEFFKGFWIDMLTRGIDIYSGYYFVDLIIIIEDIQQVVALYDGEKYNLSEIKRLFKEFNTYINKNYFYYSYYSNEIKKLKNISRNIDLYINKKKKLESELNKIYIKVNDMLLYCIYGGILCGIGYGLVFLRNGSAGGTDIITMLIRKKYSNFNIGAVNFAINLIIVTIEAIIFGIPRALYTLISMFIQGLVLDQVIRGFSSKKLMMILTEKEEEIIKYIIADMHRGVTTLPARGEFTDQDKRMLYCLVTSRQMITLKNRILSCDPKAFISILDVSEVKGRGFQNL